MYCIIWRTLFLFHIPTLQYRRVSLETHCPSPDLLRVDRGIGVFFFLLVSSMNVSSVEIWWEYFAMVRHLNTDFPIHIRRYHFQNKFKFVGVSFLVVVPWNNHRGPSLWLCPTNVNLPDILGNIITCLSRWICPLPPKILLYLLALHVCRRPLKQSLSYFSASSYQFFSYKQ